MITTTDLARAVFVVLGLALAGVLHVGWLRSSRSGRFKQPLDGGRTWRGKRLLGPNKTWRGLLAMPPAAALGFASLAALIAAFVPAMHRQLWNLSVPGYAVLGLAAGAAFMLAELPNSMFKRQLDVPAGGQPAQPMLRGLCALIDRLDSTVGVLLLLSLLPGVGTTPGLWLCALVLGPLLHAGFSVWLHRVGVKTRAL